METLGGTVFRRSVAQVRQDIEDQDIAAMKADAAQLKEEIRPRTPIARRETSKKVSELEGRIEAKQAKAKRASQGVRSTPGIEEGSPQEERQGRRPGAEGSSRTRRSDRRKFLGESNMT
jgi:hypothetical protein